MELSTAQEAAAKYMKALRVSLPGVKFVPRSHAVGSVRREKKEGISDIDILVVLPDKFKGKPLQIEWADIKMRQQTKGERRIAFRDRRRKVDVFIAYKSEEAFALFHHTGSKYYNIRLRNLAKMKGWRLNQYGVFEIATGSKVRGSGAISTERELAAFLGVSYRHPRVR